MSSGWSPRWAISISVWVARSKRNTPPKWIRATPHTTSSVRSAVRARSSPLPVATTTACSASSSPAPALVGRFAAGRPVPTPRRGHHRDPDRERQGRDQRGRPPEPEPPRLASELQHRNERPETAVRLAERAREPGLAPDRDPPGSYRGVPVELRRGGERGAEDTNVPPPPRHPARPQPPPPPPPSPPAAPPRPPAR